MTFLGTILLGAGLISLKYFDETWQEVSSVTLVAIGVVLITHGAK